MDFTYDRNPQCELLAIRGALMKMLAVTAASLAQDRIGERKRGRK
jgi:hypothetical protein